MCFKKDSKSYNYFLVFLRLVLCSRWNILLNIDIDLTPRFSILGFVFQYVRFGGRIMSGHFTSSLSCCYGDQSDLRRSPEIFYGGKTPL